MRFLKPRVVVILPSLGLGGAENFTMRLIANLEDKVDFLVIVLKNSFPRVTSSLEDRVSFFYLDLDSTYNPIIFLKKIYLFRKTVYEFFPNAVQCFLYPAEIMSLFLGKRIPIFWSLRGTGNPLETSTIKRFLMFLNLKLANIFPRHIIACSSAAFDWGVNQGIKNEKISIINNFMDKWTFTTKSNSKLIKEGGGHLARSLVFGMAARLDPHKGHLLLLNASLLYVRNTNKNVKISLIGTNTQSLEIPVLISSSEEFLSNKLQIERLGPIVDVNEKASWFSSLDLYLMISSNGEGFPNALFEAVAIGCPHIATDSGNVKEVVQEKFLIKELTPEGIMRCLESTVNDQPEILAQDLNITKEILKGMTNPHDICNSYMQLWLTPLN